MKLRDLHINAFYFGESRLEGQTLVVEVHLRRWYRWWLVFRAMPAVLASVRIERT